MKTVECILCLSRPADTKEHRVKSAAFKNTFKGTECVHFFVNNPATRKIVQGPKSSVLQFERSNLCADCNNVKSQNADKAFDTLNQLLQSESSKIDWKDKTLLPCQLSVDANLVNIASKYFSKFLICKLHESNFPIPEELRNQFWSKNPGNYCERLFLEYVKGFSFPTIRVEGPLIEIPKTLLKMSRGDLQASNFRSAYYAILIAINCVQYTYVFYSESSVSIETLQNIPHLLRSGGAAEAYK